MGAENDGCRTKRRRASRDAVNAHGVRPAPISGRLRGDARRAPTRTDGVRNGNGNGNGCHTYTNKQTHTEGSAHVLAQSTAPTNRLHRRNAGPPVQQCRRLMDQSNHRLAWLARLSVGSVGRCATRTSTAIVRVPRAFRADSAIHSAADRFTHCRLSLQSDYPPSGPLDRMRNQMGLLCCSPTGSSGSHTRRSRRRWLFPMKCAPPPPRSLRLYTPHAK